MGKFESRCTHCGRLSSEHQTDGTCIEERPDPNCPTCHGEGVVPCIDSLGCSNIRMCGCHFAYTKKLIAQCSQR